MTHLRSLFLFVFLASPMLQAQETPSRWDIIPSKPVVAPTPPSSPAPPPMRPPRRRPIAAPRRAAPPAHPVVPAIAALPGAVPAVPIQEVAPPHVEKAVPTPTVQAPRGPTSVPRPTPPRARGTPSPPPAPAPTPAPVPALPTWLPHAGRHNGVFFIAGGDESWFIIPAGRLQVDGHYFVGDGITDDYATSVGAFHRGDVKSGFQLRRARIELAGGLWKRVSFWLGAELISGTAPILTDAYLNFRVTYGLNLQVGQFDPPFSMEGRTSDKFSDFMERSMLIRAIASKEVGLMLWGEIGGPALYYAVGVFNGDGFARQNRDNGVDVVARLLSHPLAAGPLRDLQLGGSVRYGMRDRAIDYPELTLSTQAGYTFFTPQLVGGSSPVALVPDGQQLSLGVDLDLPIKRFDLRGELVYMQHNTREMASLITDSAHLAGVPLRMGSLSGYGGYVQLGAWVLGPPGMTGKPGYLPLPQLKLGQPDRPMVMALQIVARFDAVDLMYAGGDRPTAAPTAVTPTATTTPPALSADGVYTVYAVQGGINLWATRHVRLSLNYSHYFFPNHPDNHLLGPHNNPDSFGELSARAALAF